MAQPKLAETQNTLKPGLEVKLAFLHQSITIPGRLGSEKTLSHQKVPGIKMQWTPYGLWVWIKGEQAIIPAANVCVAILKEAQE